MHRSDDFYFSVEPYHFVRQSGLRSSDIHSPVPRWQRKRRLFVVAAVTVLIATLFLVRFV
jgi:hypothetical protein